MYAGDTNAWNAAQQTAACFGARLAADALYTLICLARDRFGPDEAGALQRIDLTYYAPLEAPDLYLPQAAFFSRPYWGYATVGASLRDGKTAVPLALRVSEAGRETIRVFEHGVGVGTRSVLTYLIPKDVYARFQVSAGLHAELGGSGHVRFEILGNGKRLADLSPVQGTMPAHTLDLPLAGITNLQLIATSAGGDGSGNHAVWGAPRLLKEER
ncbi:MAG TPA: NPCBM/NEW2 domain-containing protein [Kiritimatiellia bacterium]|nr:NPCBM/NEW2 domain-containing protein [Kiritimatiellia bacterium]